MNIIMPTICNAPETLARAVFDSIEEAAPGNANLIVCAPVSEPVPGLSRWNVICENRWRDPYEDCYRRLLLCIEQCDDSPVFIVEHDVLYHPAYFQTMLVTIGDSWKKMFCYQTHVHTLTKRGFIPSQERIVTSNLCAGRKHLDIHYEQAWSYVNYGKKILIDEPGFGWKNFPAAADYRTFCLSAPNLDVRWGGNLTGDRKARRYVSDSATWGNYRELRTNLGLEE